MKITLRRALVAAATLAAVFGIGIAAQADQTTDKIKATLGDAVKEVRASSRLADSPSVIVSDEDEPSARMRQMMRAMGQKEIPEPTPTLEINPDHEIVKKLLASPEDARVADAAWLLFDQALLLEGVPLKDPSAFVQRLNRVLNQSI